MHSFDWGPLPSSVYQSRQNIIHMIKWTRASHSVFVYYKQSKPEQLEGLETRLHEPHTSELNYWFYTVIRHSTWVLTL